MLFQKISQVFNIILNFLLFNLILSYLIIYYFLVSF